MTRPYFFCKGRFQTLNLGREGDTRGERERLPRRPTKIVSRPQYTGSRCVICQKFWQKTTDLAQTRRAAIKPCAFYPRSKYICYKDQLGYLIIERWRNKLMVNTQLKSFLTTGTINRKKQSKKWVSFKECMLWIIKS